MERQVEGYMNCIEVKGIHRLRNAYIKRWFGRAGPVEEVKIQDDRVIVRFKHHASVAKAQRYSGWIIDKEPLKIRNMGQFGKKEDFSQPLIPKTPTKAPLKFDYDKFHEKTKFGPLDVPFHWAQVLKIIDLLPDCRGRWLMHEVFSLQLHHVLHHIYFKANEASSFNQVQLKEFLANHGNLKAKIETLHNLQKLELPIHTPSDFDDEDSLAFVASEAENKLRYMLKNFKQFGMGNRALHLYTIFYRFALLPSEHCTVLSPEAQPTEKKEYRRIEMELKTKNRLQISVQEWNNSGERSEYRNVDETHPSKIQILSDTRFHLNPYTKTFYDIFKDSFDGTLIDNNAADIFHELKSHFAPNYLLIRHLEGQKIMYIRLDFQLRLLNCSGFEFQVQDFGKILSYQSYSQAHGFIEAESATLSRHCLVLSSFENPEKAVYLVENYANLFCLEDQSPQNEENQRQNEPILTVFTIVKSPDEIKMAAVEQIYAQLQTNETMRKIKFQMYVICLRNTISSVEEHKLKNFIHDYAQQLPYQLTDQTIKPHAQNILLKNQDKFRGISDASKFVEDALWNTYLIKRKTGVGPNCQLNWQVDTSL